MKGVDSDSSGCVFPRRVVGSWLPKVGSLFALVIVLIKCGKSLAFLLVAEKCCCGMFFDSSLQWCARARFGDLGKAYREPAYEPGWRNQHNSSMVLCFETIVFFVCNTRSGNLSVSIGAEAARNFCSARSTCDCVFRENSERWTLSRRRRQCAMRHKLRERDTCCSHA